MLNEEQTMINEKNEESCAMKSKPATTPLNIEAASRKLQVASYKLKH
jgi:hypothetical protein